ncbi:MAG: hypothetical protein II776_05650 [Clostridia bacterium]|nr:hypothetical protein [Clostridia bacterium]
MKRGRMIFLLLTLCLVLTSCGSAGLSVDDEEGKTVETEEQIEAFAAVVTLEGEGRADTALTAKTDLRDTKKLRYDWVLDGKTLSCHESTLQIPCSAGDKELICRVTCEGMEGEAVSEPLTVTPREEGAAFTMAGLWDDVKWINRTAPEGAGLRADWSASGFEMALWSADCDFTVYYETASKTYFSVFVDGEEVARPLLQDAGSFSVPLTRGEHIVRVCRESEIQTSGSGVVLKSVVFDGEVLERPADKDLLIHVIGDSISCGDGALGVYQSGQKWALADHSGTHGFGYLLCEMMDADYDLVGKGGIGLIKPAGQYNVQELYDYVNRYHDATKYDFDRARTPDVILLEQGANDSSSVATEDEYYMELLKFIKTLREKWGDGPAIVWVGKNQAHYESALRAVSALKKDEKLFALRTPYGGAGSAALETQKAGHPSAAEQAEMAGWIRDFLLEKGIVSQ